ncbi:hypothetical protein WJX74_005514 [Apatococcus lobatus]|uniref:Homoserine kinase n=1 Tax=Apatococcus lobatus TaxID=904363 RepID=A0AAW1RFS1_9CHLO
MIFAVSWRDLRAWQNCQSDFTPRRFVAKQSVCCRSRKAARCQLSRGVEPVRQDVTVFAPATIANLGPGFDWLGCAVKGQGDLVTARLLPDQPQQVLIERIEGDGGRLPLEATKNCAGIAALETLKAMGYPPFGVSLSLIKGLPLGSGLGSSAASAAAAAGAVNALFGDALTRQELVLPGLCSEAAVSGYHADNIAPSILGGFVLIRSCDPLDISQLRCPSDLHFVLVNPEFETPTKQMRAALSPTVPMASAVHNARMGGSLVAGILAGDPVLIGQALDGDVIVEPVRGPLIPGFAEVKAAAKAAGAYGCTISGAGPTCVAVVSDPQVGTAVAAAMEEAFTAASLKINSTMVTGLDQTGICWQQVARLSAASEAQILSFSFLQDETYKSPIPTLGFLNRALVCAELASRAYSSPCLRMVEGSPAEPETIPLPALPKALAVNDGSCPRSFQATLVASQLCSNAQRSAEIMQYGIWYVQHMGYVVAFRGSEHGLDWLCSLKTGSIPLQGAGSAATVVRLHEGIYVRVLANVSKLLAAISYDVQRRNLQSLQEGSEQQQHVVMTGHSLGGGFATAMLLHLLGLRHDSSDASVASYDNLELDGAYTFGAPLVLADIEGLDSFLASCSKPQAACKPRFHNFVNQLDIVPRLLGKSLRITNELSAIICLALGMPLPEALQGCTSFVPFGRFHLLKDGQVQSIESSSQPSLLRYGLGTRPLALVGLGCAGLLAGILNLGVSCAVLCKVNKMQQAITSLGQDVQAVRFWLHTLYAAAAISVDTSRAFLGDSSNQRCCAACKHLQDQVSEALEGATLYDVAQPAVRQLLAQHKCLILSLQQAANGAMTSPGIASELAQSPKVSHPPYLQPGYQKAPSQPCPALSRFTLLSGDPVQAQEAVAVAGLSGYGSSDAQRLPRKSGQG